MTNQPTPADYELKQLDSGAAVLSLIVEWPHRRGGRSRCLGRLLIRASSQVIGVLSDVRGNPAGRGVTADPAGAALALVTGVRSVRDPGGAAEPATVLWILHHGSFSAFDNPAAPETFTAAERMRWDGQSYADDLDGHRLLPAAEAGRLLDDALDPVPDILARLGWQP